MLTLRGLCLAILLALPFTKSLTLDVGFSFKLYEMLIPLALVAAFREGPVDTGPHSRFLRVWLVFLFLSLFPSAWGYTLVTQRDLTDLTWAVGRYDPLVNVLFHTVYLGLNIMVLAVFLAAFHSRRLSVMTFCRWWCYGALAAVAYAGVLNLAHWSGAPLALVGRAGELQTMPVLGLDVVRSGPFEEGNYFGLYLVCSMVIALWAGARTGERFWYRCLPLFAAGIFVSASPAALAVVVVLLGVTAVHPATPRGFRVVTAVVIVGVMGALLGTDLFRKLVLDKFSLLIFGGITDAGNISLMQRTNEMVHAWRVFLDHPVGVGIGNFGYFWGDHPEFFTELDVDYNAVKQIPNMVYLEILSEQGAQGLVLFLFAMGSLSSALYWRRERLLLLGLWAMLAYFVVFPTFRLVFLWVFWAFLLAAAARSDRERESAR